MKLLAKIWPAWFSKPSVNMLREAQLYQCEIDLVSELSTLDNVNARVNMLRSKIARLKKELKESRNGTQAKKQAAPADTDVV